MIRRIPASGAAQFPRKRSLFAILFLATALSISIAFAQAPSGALAVAPCPLTPGPVAPSARVIDADAIALADGTEVRLIGSLAPRPLLAARPWRIEKTAEAALRELVEQRPLALGFSGRRQDRHGRWLAHVFVERDGAWLWVQGEMLERGLGRAYGLPGNFGCMAALRARERVAREKRIGLWRDKAFRVLEAGDAKALQRLQNTFQVVGGEVRRVKRLKNRVYFDFGDDWREDFSAGGTRGSDSLAPDWTLKAEALAGRRIEVRGWIERRFGPFVEIWDASQIEVVGNAVSREDDRMVRSSRHGPDPPEK